MTIKIQNKDQQKELQKVLSSYVTVATHKLGRTPSLEDLMKFLNGEVDLGDGDVEEGNAVENAPSNGSGVDSVPPSVPEESEIEDDNAEPDLIHTKAYYGIGEGGKPDPSKILFYEGKDGRCYDCHNKTTLDGKPLWLDSLPSRPLEVHDKDLVHAILHGQVSDRDFRLLDKNGLMSDTCKRLWELSSHAHEYSKQLEGMSDQETAEPLVKSEDALTFMTSLLKASGLSHHELDISDDEMITPGEDVFKKIWSACLDRSLDKKIEARVREIVREEMQMAGGVIGEPELPEFQIEE
jgi:hypothetical protein